MDNFKIENTPLQKSPKFTPSVIGVFLAIAGILLLIREFGFPVPEVLLRWPVQVIAVGVIVLVINRFEKPIGLFIILGGVIFLFPEFNLERFIWPIAMLGFGINLIFFKKKFNARGLRKNKNWFHTYGGKYEKSGSFKSAETNSSENANYFADNFKASGEPEFKENDPNTLEYLDENVFFGSIKKVVVSKNFGGGEVNAIFGGVEINLLNADFQKTITLDCNQIFAGLILIIPTHWQVVSETIAVFGSVEDKRMTGMPLAEGKKLVIRGNSIFGGVEIRN